MCEGGGSADAVVTKEDIYFRMMHKIHTQEEIPTRSSLHKHPQTVSHTDSTLSQVLVYPWQS